MSPTPRIAGELAGEAIDALQTFLRSQSKLQKSQLFEHEDFLYLHLSLLRFPSTSRTNPHIIPLPHSLHPLDPSRTSLCLITADSPAETAAFRSAAAAAQLPFDSIISLSDLRADYRAFESRRKLCDSYDVFFADRRIITLLPRLIGNYFFKKKKIPVGINLSRPGWPEAVRRVCGSTLLFVGSGTSVGMKVGRVCMDREEIVDNLMAAVEGAVERVPKKWGNVRCVYVKAAHSVSLPIYQVVPQMGMKIVVDGKGGEEREKSGKKRVGSKKRKGRIHDVDYVGGEVAEDREEEKKKKEKKVKEVKFDQFVELGDGRKMRKRAKKIVKSEVEEYGIKGGLEVDAIVAIDEDNHGDDMEHLVKKKVKSKSRKGKNVGDAAIATVADDDGDHVDDEHSNVGRKVKNNEKIGKDKVKKVKKIKLRK